jgi:dipeptidyl aminopeptidase/acylaminoacyl peptidase
MRAPHSRFALFLLLFLAPFAGVPPAAGQQAAEARAAAPPPNGKVLTLDEYPGWKRIQSPLLSPDGRWMAYAYRPNEGDDTLFLRELDGRGLHTIVRGSTPAFSGDSRWAAYTVSPPERNAGGRGQAGQRGQTPPAPRPGAQTAAPSPPRTFELLDLRTGEKWEVSDIESSAFSSDARFLAVRRNRANREAAHEGADLVLRDLHAGTVRNFGNVGAYAFNKSGGRLAYTVDAADRTGNGLYLLDLKTGVVTALDTKAEDYRQMAWSEEGTAVAVLRGLKPERQTQRANVLLAFRALDRQPAVVTYDPAKDGSFPAGFVLSELGAVRWTKDGSRITLGVKAQEPELESGGEPRPDVEVWHWNDGEVQSVQKVRAEQTRRFTYASVFNVALGRFLKLADDSMRTVTFTDDGRWGIGRAEEPYRLELSWGGGRADYYRIDLTDGARELMVPALRRAMGSSPDGKWFLYLKDEKLQVRELAGGRTLDLSALAGVSFVDTDDDHDYEKPAWGLGGWSKDGKSVIVNHKFDLWQLPLAGGKALKLTAGAGDPGQIRFRVASTAGGGGRGGGFGGGGPAQEIDTSRPILLSAYGEWSKQSGYYEVNPGSAPTPLLFEDMAIGQLQKADSSERYILTKQTFREFPDWWVASRALADARKVTDANPQIADYAWGRRILVDYTDARGNKLQATLALPANYEPGRRYPMLVYFYEKQSQTHHQFSMPVYDDRPHMSAYASDGYLVLQPDIVYEIGKPGSSALDDVGSAVRKVIELGYADSERIGLQGHSWGGYQSSFMVTQTDLFAAVVTGAPPTNLVSFYNELYKSTGTVQQGITEIGQVRMGEGANPWTAHELYESQSPVHQAERITTPFLILHGTNDGAVDWHQGLEFYNAAKRLGKKVILLSYNGEDHHLNRKENQKDFQVRMKQFFDHYLKGKPAPRWMTDGVPFVGRERAGTGQ